MIPQIMGDNNNLKLATVIYLPTLLDLFFINIENPLGATKTFPTIIHPMEMNNVT